MNIVGRGVRVEGVTWSLEELSLHNVCVCVCVYVSCAYACVRVHGALTHKRIYLHAHIMREEWEETTSLRGSMTCLFVCLFV